MFLGVNYIVLKEVVYKDYYCKVFNHYKKKLVNLQQNKNFWPLYFNREIRLWEVNARVYCKSKAIELIGMD